MTASAGLSAAEISREVAELAIGLVHVAEPDDWCHSLLFPPGYFEREVIETVEVIGGIRRVAVPNVLLKIDFNLDKFVPLADSVLRALVSEMTPMLEGSGRVLKDSPEGLIVVLREDWAVGDEHARQFCPKFKPRLS